VRPISKKVNDYVCPKCGNWLEQGELCEECEEESKDKTTIDRRRRGERDGRYEHLRSRGRSGFGPED
jgi:predicted amidophosphoribosyltransferase